MSPKAVVHTACELEMVFTVLKDCKKKRKEKKVTEAICILQSLKDLSLLGLLQEKFATSRRKEGTGRSGQGGEDLGWQPAALQPCSPAWTPAPTQPRPWSLWRVPPILLPLSSFPCSSFPLPQALVPLEGLPSLSPPPGLCV